MKRSEKNGQEGQEQSSGTSRDPTTSGSGLTGTMAFDPDGERKDAEIAILEEKGGKFDVIEMVK